MLKRNLELKCSIKPDAGNCMEDLEELKEALYRHGIILNASDAALSVFIDHKYYNEVNSRNAGRKRKRTKSADGGSYYYSDIVYMLQKMTVAEAIKETGIPQASFFRHKKAMLNSPYYKQLDKKKLNDLDYLKENELDRPF